MAQHGKLERKERIANGYKTSDCDVKNLTKSCFKGKKKRSDDLEMSPDAVTILVRWCRISHSNTSKLQWKILLKGGRTHAFVEFSSEKQTHKCFRLGTEVITESQNLSDGAENTKSIASCVDDIQKEPFLAFWHKTARLHYA